MDQVTRESGNANTVGVTTSIVVFRLQTPFGSTSNRVRGDANTRKSAASDAWSGPAFSNHPPGPGE
jgi:hypothetical protein